MKVKTITRWHILYITVGNKKCVTITIIDEDVKHQAFLVIVGGSINCYNHFGKQFGIMLCGLRQMW